MSLPVVLDSVPPPSRWRAFWRGTLLYGGIWTFIGLLTSELQYIAISSGPGTKAPFYRVLLAGLINIWLWAAFTPFMIRLARRYRIDRATWRAVVPIHVVWALFFALVDTIYTRGMLPWSSPFDDITLLPFYASYLRGLFINLASYLAVVALTHAVDFARMYRDRELAAAQLAEQLARAQLQALQTQLRPHFLFNTLNTIAEQVYTDPAGADRMITRLGALLRMSFSTADRDEITLGEELELLQNYIDIMRVRLKSRVDVTIDAPPDTLGEMVPTLVLQPLVENALRHGIEPLEHGGRVEIVCRRRFDSLVLEVRDDGAGLAATPHEGVGTRNTRERIAQRYGPGASFALRPRVGGGVIAAVSIPRPSDWGQVTGESGRSAAQPTTNGTDPSAVPHSPLPIPQ
jgi:signal transduction histidine kinase